MLDIYIAGFVESIRTPFWFYFFKVFSFLGDALTIIVVLFVIGGVSLIVHKRHAWSVLFFSILTGVGFSLLMKEFFGRARPIGAVVMMPSSYSFPSGHALISTVCYGMIGYYIYHHSRKPSVRVLGLFVIFVIPLLVGISRVYLGVHWMSDVVAGWITGAIIVWFFVYCHKKMFRSS